MPLDPQISDMLANMPAWPGIRSLPVSALREAVRDSSMAMPPPQDARVAQVEDRNIPGPGGSLPIRIYTPEGGGPFPVIVYFHGGGFVVGDLDTQDMIARGLASGAASIVISVGYRLAPEHKFPAAPEDAWSATLWAAAHAAEIGGDPERLAVAGDSAGGVLASAVAIQARDAGGPRLAAVVNWYGPGNHPIRDSESTRDFADGPILRMDDVHYFWELYLASDEQYADFRASPARAESHMDLPPSFIASAECDPIRDETEAYGEVLKAAGVEVEAKRYPGMVHGFVSWVGFLPGARQAMDDACVFLQRQFAKVPA
jgi:acetyl esterase